MSPREDLTPWHAAVRWLVTDASSQARLPIRRCFGSGSCWLRARHFSRLRNRLEAFSEKRPVPAYFAPIATPGSPLFWLGFLLASRSTLLPASQMARSFFRKTARSGTLRATCDSRSAVVLARVPAGFALGTSPGFATGSKLFPRNGPFRHTSRRSRLPVRRCFGSGSCWLRARHFSRLRKWLEARTRFAQSSNP